MAFENNSFITLKKNICQKRLHIKNYQARIFNK